MNGKLVQGVIDVARGSDYPPPFDAPCRDSERKRLGDAAGLSQFGVNLLRLPPGTWSSQRHWQIASDEFVYVVSGEVVLITDAGEETLGAGDAAGFKAGTPDGHHLQNRSTSEALVLGWARGSFAISIRQENDATQGLLLAHSIRARCRALRISTSQQR